MRELRKLTNELRENAERVETEADHEDHLTVRAMYRGMAHGYSYAAERLEEVLKGERV